MIIVMYLHYMTMSEAKLVWFNTRLILAIIHQSNRLQKRIPRQNMKKWINDWTNEGTKVYKTIL